MALTYKDRVRETTTTTGTGTFTLAGAVTGFQAFSVIGNTNTCYYVAESVDANGTPTGDWETGIGTYTLSGTTLARTTVLASSNGGSAVNFGAGTKQVYVAALASVVASMVRTDTTATMTVGFDVTSYSAGTKSTGTYTPAKADGNMQYAVNGGAHTLAPPATDTTIIVQYTNNGSAGTITTSSFTKVSGSFTTTNGDDFMCFLTRNNGFTHLSIVALQ